MNNICQLPNEIEANVNTKVQICFLETHNNDNYCYIDPL